MRAVLQRVRRAAVSVDGHIVGAVDAGLLVLLAVGRGDAVRDAGWVADKVAGMRIFPDGSAAMTLDVREVGGQVLSVSQFTLYADVRRGRRPSFSDAAPAESARLLWEHFNGCLRAAGVPVATGQFQADMDVELVNWGPVTVLLESPRRPERAGID